MQRGSSRHVHFLSTAFFISWGLLGFAGCGGEQLSNSAVCGNGVIQADEECDDGPSNSETANCSPNCILNICGDGLVLKGIELCDSGALNSDETPDSCRSDCTPSRCGDNVTDTGEECDDGEANSNTEPDVCRVNCVNHGCGDGVLDAIEECDNGTDNSDDLVDGCRTNCQNAWCGDGIKDNSEVCDDGSANSNVVPDACRENCTPPSCGDGVTDINEDCDNGENNSDTEPDACRTDCSLPLCNATELPFSTHAKSAAIFGYRGDSVAVTCDSGYTGGGDWVCGEDGNFTGAPCITLPCDGAQADNSQDHSVDNSITGKTGDSVEVACTAGYEGGGTWTCQPNGDNNGFFTGEKCTPIPCVSTNVPNSTGYDAEGSLKGATGEAIPVTCEAGYDGGGEWTCGANGGEAGVFTGAPCVPQACDPAETPNTLAHTSVGSITGATDQTVVVECAPGFSGGGTWTCGANHTFTGPPCTAGGCTATQTPFSDKKTKDSINGAVDGSVEVTCDIGYTGGGSWTCRVNAEGEGVFSGPECIPVACDPTETPNTVAHSDPDSITADTGRTVNVVCAEGFFGGGTWTCNPNGSITGPRCSAEGCNGAQTPYSDHSVEDSINGSVGGTVEVTCDEGYTGGGTWTCNADLTFTGPACGFDTCISEKVAFSSHAADDAINGENGAVIEVVCNDGYTGGGTWTCLPDRTFAAGAPCDPDDCTAITAPEHGAMGDCPESFESGSTCVPTCDAGHYRDGESSCLAGTLTHASCKICGAGTYSPAASTECTPVTKCGPGSGVVSAGTDLVALAKEASSEGDWSDILWASSVSSNHGSLAGLIDGTISNDATPDGPMFHSDDSAGIKQVILDLGAVRMVGDVIIHNRTDCCDDRIKGTQVWVSTEAKCLPDVDDSIPTGIWVHATTVNSTDEVITLPVHTPGRCVRLYQTAGENLNIPEMKVTGSVGSTVGNTSCEDCTVGGSWNNSDDSKSACVPISTCGLGSGQTKEASRTVDTACGDCDGTTTFSDENSVAVCKPIGTCGVGRGMTALSTSADIACEDCDGTSTFSDVKERSACQGFGVTCPPGEGVSTARTTSNDASCVACEANTTWNNTNNGTDVCVAVQVCADGAELKGATAKNDGTCNANACAPMTVANSGHAVEPLNGNTDETLYVACEAGYEDAEVFNEKPNHSSIGHSVGAYDSNGGSTHLDEPGWQWVNNNTGWLSYGPYKALPAGTYECEVEIGKTSHLGNGEIVIAEVDAFQAGGAGQLAYKDVSAANFLAYVAGANAPPGSLVKIRVPFTHNGTGTIECRVKQKTNTAYSLVHTRTRIVEVGAGGGAWTCGANGVFTGKGCFPSACGEKRFGHANATLNGVTGDSFNVSCADGRSGGGTWTCGSDGTFGGVGDDTAPAGNCGPCGAGSYSTGGADCVSCAAGQTFASGTGNTACTPVATCGHGKGVVSEPTLSANTVCEDCVVGQTWNNTDDTTSLCLDVGTCEPGKGALGDLVALAKAASQQGDNSDILWTNSTPTSWGSLAGLIDENITNDVTLGGGHFHTGENQDGGNTVAIDLTAVRYVERIKIWNRTDCCQDRISDGVGAEVWTSTAADCFSTISGGGWSGFTVAIEAITSSDDEIVLPVNTNARCIAIWDDVGDKTMNIRELDVIGAGSSAQSDTTCEACVEGVSWNNSTDATSPCELVKTCSAGHGVGISPTTISDTSCTPCTAGITYSSATNASEGCLAVKKCGSGSGVTKSPTSSTDTICGACAAGQKWNNTNNSADACSPVDKCSPGNGVQTPPTPTSNTVCELCASGVTWNGVDDSVSGCSSVDTCGSGSGAKTPATSSSDTVCESCESGVTWSGADNTSACEAVKKCAVGTGVSSAPTPSSNTECVGCQANSTYNNTDDAVGICKPVSVCPGGSTLTGATVQNDGSCGADACAPITVVHSSHKATPLAGNTGDKIQVDCDAGYSGGNIWTCGSNHKFTGANCVAKSCAQKTFGNSSAVLNGKTGETRSVTCNDGYEGGGTWTCGTNSSFSGTGCTACPKGKASSGGVPCSSCLAGSTFADTTAQSSCTNRRSCKAGQGVSAVSTPSADTQCQGCAAGQTYSDQNSPTQTCQSVSTCDFGRGVSSAPTAKADTGCTPCSPGSFSIQNNSTADCSSCDSGEVQPSSGQSNCSPCYPGQYDDGSSEVCKTCPQYNTSAAGATSCYGDDTDGDGDGVVSSEDTCPTSPQNPTCSKAEVHSVSSVDQGAIHLTGGFVGGSHYNAAAGETGYSWHKVTVPAMVDPGEWNHRPGYLLINNPGSDHFEMVVFLGNDCADAGATNTGSNGEVQCEKTPEAKWDPGLTNYWDFWDGNNSKQNAGYVGNCSGTNSSKGCTKKPDYEWAFDIHNSSWPLTYFIRLSRKTTGSTCRDYDVVVDITNW